jgi:hypothetical protein
VAETSDKLKFVGHFRRPFALLPSLPAVSVIAALHFKKQSGDDEFESAPSGGSATRFTPDDAAFHPEIQISTPGDRSVPYSAPVAANVEGQREHQGARYERNRRAI